MKKCQLGAGMNSRFLAVVLFVLLFCASVEAVVAADCKQSDIIVADRAKFFPTIRRALAVIDDAGLIGLAMPFREGSSVTEFAGQVARHQPKLLVAHFSMFAPGSSQRGALLSAFFAAQQANEPPPLHFVVYSSSIGPQGHSLRSLRALGFFEAIGDDQITLIHVPNGQRFLPGRGDVELRAILNALREQGMCE